MLLPSWPVNICIMLTLWETVTERHSLRGSLSNVNSMGDCDGATQSECRWSFLVTAFHVIPWFECRDVHPLY